MRKENEFLKMDKNMITIFNINEGASRKSRGEEVNLFVYICSELGKALTQAATNGEDLEKFTLELPYREIHEVLFNRPLLNKTVRVDNLMEVVKKINNLEGVTMILYEDPKSKQKSILYDRMQIYSRIQIEGQAKHYDNAIFKVKLTEDFIEYYKQVLSKKSDYFKLELDIMFSLTTKNSKIVYAYLSRYHDQMNKHWSTNETNIEDLMYYLDNKKVVENDKWVYKMSTEQLKKIIANALDDINKAVMLKREKYEIYIPIYNIEYFQLDPNATRGPKTKITKFRFYYVDEGQKIDVNRLKYVKEESYESIICNTFEDEPTRNILREFVTKGSEAEELPSLKSFKTQVENLKELSKDEILERVSTSILNKDYRSLDYNKQVAEKLKTKPEPIVTNRENRHFDIGLKSRVRGRK